MSRSDRWRYPHGLIDPAVPVAFSGGPLQLRNRGVWDPATEYWGEAEDTIAAPLAHVIAAGPRRGLEFEQLLPGGDNPNPADPTLEALELRDRGEPGRATQPLEGLVEWDARCLDAHAHLGALTFADDDPASALQHYATGVNIAERSLPEDFDGVLSWGWIDNRPFLRCLHGLAISAWRLAEHDTAETLCWALLWLNPGDNKGASALVPEIIAGEPWHS